MDNKKVRLAVGMESFQHKILKMCCAQMGVTITEFVLEAVNDAVDLYLYQKEFNESIKAEREKNGVDKQESLGTNGNNNV